MIITALATRRHLATNVDLSSERTAYIGDTTNTPFIGCCNVAER